MPDLIAMTNRMRAVDYTLQVLKGTDIGLRSGYGAFAVILAWFGSVALAQPTFRILPPVEIGTTSPEVRPDFVRGKAIAEDLQVRREIIFVEGFRDPDDRYKAPGSVESRVGNILNAGSPELISGNNYDGCLYTTGYFSCSNPLVSIYKNAKLWTR